jgi:GGDEF domain-containing protein
VTRVLVAVTSPPARAQILDALKSMSEFSPVVAPPDQPLAGIVAGDWLVVEASRPGTNGYDLAAAARKRGAGKVLLVLSPDEDPGGVLVRAAQATAAIRTPCTREQVSAGLRGDALRPPVEELLMVAEERVANQRGELAQRVLAGVSGPPEGDMTLFLTDPATGLYHRSFMDMRLDEEFKRARRFQMPLSVVLAAVQGIAQPAAKSLLVEVAGLFLNSCRDIDSVGRFHADRFLLLLPATGRDGCHTLLGRLWQGMLQLHAAGGDTMSARCAFGSCTYPAPGLERRGDLLVAAERALGAALATPALPRVRCD